MKLPDINELRAQANIDHRDDDKLLLMYSSAARIAIENYLNRKLYEDQIPDNDTTGISVNEAIKVAIMMLVAHWYDNREVVSVGSAPAVMPLAYEMLIKPYRKIAL